MTLPISICPRCGHPLTIDDADRAIAELRAEVVRLEAQLWHERNAKAEAQHSIGRRSLLDRIFRRR